MSTVRHVRLIEEGGEQALRIPREFKLPGTEATIRQDGPRLVIEPVAADGPNAALLALLASWEPIDEEIGPIDDPPPEPVDL